MSSLALLHLREVAGLVSPVRPVARLTAPHAGQVERSPSQRNRLLNPLDGITRSARRELCASPALCDDGLVDSHATRSVRIAPAPARGKRNCASDRIAGLLGRQLRLANNASRMVTGLLDKASVELGERVSPHPALRANRTIAGETIPLAALARHGFAGAVGRRRVPCLPPLPRATFLAPVAAARSDATRQPRPRHPILGRWGRFIPYWSGKAKLHGEWTPRPCEGYN